MPDDYLHRALRSGTSEFAALADVPDSAQIRRRGDRRKRRNLIVSGLLAFAVGAGGGGLAYTMLDKPSRTAPEAATSHRPASAAGVAPTQSAAPAESAAPGGRPGIVAVTTGGVVEVLDPETLDATRLLTGNLNAVGDQVSVTPDGKSVYFAAKQSCTSYIMRVPADGSAKPARLASGVLPAVSPDGTKLAFIREPFSGGPGPRVSYVCGGSGGAMSQLVIMDIATGATSSRPIGILPVSHVSWAADSDSLLLSAGPVDQAGRRVWALDTVLASGTNASGTNASGTVPVTGDNIPASYYREGIYLPDGDLLVNRICCTPASVTPHASVILRITSGGSTVHRIAKAFPDKDHTSMAVDPTGRWIMYLAGNDLFVSHDGGTPQQVTSTSGLIAATWL